MQDCLELKTNTPTNLIDIFPTLCELSGIETPANLDGKSLVPILRDSSKKVQDYAASIYSHDKRWGITIRTERYRYTAWYKGWKNKSSKGNMYLKNPEHVELYDYDKDAEEKANLAKNPEYAGILKKMAKLHKEHMAYTQTKQFK